MAIDLKALKPLLAPLLEGRDDAADVIDSIAAIDAPGDENTITQEDLDAAVKEANDTWAARYQKQFFNPEPVDDKKVDDKAQSTAPPEDPDDGEPTPETVDFDDILKEESK